MSDDHIHSPEPESSGLTGYAAIKYTAIVIIVLAILAFLTWYIMPAFDWGAQMNASQNEPSRTAPNVERDQTLLEELVWSVALIGGVIAFLVLVVQLSS
jgi:magnesium-transporting ATPase (P-type)